MDSTILQRLLSQLTPEQLAQFVAESEAGEENPRLAALLDPRRRPSFSFHPEISATEDKFATYGGDLRANIPLGKNTTLDLSAGGMAGHGYGRARGEAMRFAPRGNVQFRHEF